VQLSNVCAHVKRAPSYCIQKSGSAKIILDNDCSLLQGLQDALLEYAPLHSQILVDVVADDLAALFDDDVFSASICISQQTTPVGVCLSSSLLASSSAAGIDHGLAAVADSLGCVVAAVHSAMPGVGAAAECSLSKGIASALVHRVERRLCTFASNCAGDFLQAQKWSEALQHLPPHVFACSEPVATFWERWTDKRSSDVVNATQQQLLQMNTGSCPRQCRNAQEWVGFVSVSKSALTLCACTCQLKPKVPSTSIGMRWILAFPMSSGQSVCWILRSWC
jgi:hypothetical protein